jgi:hypothetical protein
MGAEMKKPAPLEPELDEDGLPIDPDLDEDDEDEDDEDDE